MMASSSEDIVARRHPAACKMKVSFVVSSRLLCFALWYSAVVVEVTQGQLVQKVGQIASGSCATVKKALNIDDLDEAIRPSDVDKIPVHFKSRDLEKTFTLSNAGSEIAKLPGYKQHAPLIVVLQGITGIPGEPDFSSITKALLKKKDYSIISLGVGTIVDFLTLKSLTVRRIGECLGEVFGAMAHAGLDPSVIHIIGHSLGANMASYAAKMFTKATRSKVGRISGLDPAGPCFSHIDPDLRLKADDATFVDVIHTDDGVLGYEYRIGHVDFYPNGGKLQPNCFLPTCSHGRAMELFVESISQPEAFSATACNDYKSFQEGKCSNIVKEMGFDCENVTRGKQYLKTGDRYPYGLGDKGAIYNNQPILAPFPVIGG